MLNIKYIFRKKNTYIYMILFLLIFIFIMLLDFKLHSLNDNDIIYEYYFLVNEDNLNNIDEEDILYEEKCLLINNITVFRISEELSNDDIILPFSISIKDNVINELNFNVIKTDNEGYVSNKKYEEYKDEYGYTIIYLKKFDEYDKYEELINNIYLSVPANLDNTKNSIAFIKIIIKLLNILLIILFVILVLNNYYDNKKHNKMLKLFGYTNYRIFIITIIQNLIIIIWPFILFVIIRSFM